MELLRRSAARRELALEGLLIIEHRQVIWHSTIEHHIVFRYPSSMGGEEAKAIARDFVAQEYQASGCHMWYTRTHANGTFTCSFTARY